MAILRRTEPLTDVDLETERHALNASTCILTPGARRDGLSAVEPARLGRGIAAVEEAFGLPSRLSPDAFYTPDFLPPAEARALPAA
jgi:NitT/TauT family transport system substrate-binding protein